MNSTCTVSDTDCRLSINRTLTVATETLKKLGTCIITNRD